MAEVTTNSQHLTSLDLDISKIATNLKTIETQIANTVKEIQNNPKYKINLDLSYSTSSVNSELKNQNNAIKDATSSMEGYSKVTTTFDENGKKLSQTLKGNINDFDTYSKTIKVSKDNTESFTKTITINNEARANATAKQIADEKKLQSTVAKIEAEILARDEKNTAKQIANDKKIVDARTQLEKNYSLLWNNLLDARETKYITTTRKIEDLISKQVQQINALGSGSYDSSLLVEANTNLQNLKSSQAELSNTNFASSGLLSNVDEYGRKIKTIDNTMKETTHTSNTFLNTIADKARWLSAFYLIQMVQQGFFALVDTVKDTEDAVIELQRVLNDTSLGDTTIQTELYNIAQAYGRSFEEVSDSAVKFAQTGASFNESLQLTEATMLAVNTAELEVETATTGLIAVMSQFNIESSDMIDIIDKINITADNYAVTSEKIVSALQRFGSASNQANVSLEQSIALITAMSEATGRSGETMGTAINSLLVYTQRDTALDVFANLSDGMSNLVAQYRNGTASIIDVWVELSKTLETKQGAIEQLSAGVADTSDWEQFTSSIENDAQELVDEVEKVYGTAGTHRQNYLVAILNNMETYSDSLKTMLEDSEGYSLSENEKAMETLTRQYQTLIESVKALAVEFGNAGFLDALKWFVQLGIGATELIDNLGGLKTVLYAISTMIITMKLSALSKTITTIGSSFSALTTKLSDVKVYSSLAFNNLINGVRTSDDEMKLLGLSTATLKTTMMQLASVGIGLVITAISLYRAKLEEAKQASIDLWRETTSLQDEMANSLNTISNEVITLNKTLQNYDSTVEETAQANERLKEIQGELVGTYGDVATAVDLTTGSIEQQIDAIKRLGQESAKQYLKDNEGLLQDAEDYFTDIFDITNLGLFTGLDSGIINDEIGRFLEGIDAEGLSYNIGLESYELEISGTREEIAKYYDDLYDYVKEYGELNKDVDKEILDSTLRMLSDRSNKITKSDDYETYSEARISGLQAEIRASEDFYDIQKDILELEEGGLTESSIESMLQSYPELNVLLQELGISLEDLHNNTEEVQDLFGNLFANVDEPTEVFKTLGYDATKAEESIKALSSEIDGVQSSFSTINEAMGEYNTTGTLSIDMVQQLMSLSGEYASALTFENGQLSYVNQTTGEVINSKQKLIESYIQESTMAQLASLAEYYLALQESDTATMTETAGIATGGYAQELETLVIKAMNGTVALGDLKTALTNYANASGIESKYADDFTRDASQIISNAQNMYAQIGSIANDTSTWGSDGINSANEQAKKANEARIDELKEQQDAIKDRYNAEIDALKKVKEQNDRIIDQEEYLKKLREAKKDLASAEARSGVEYREDEENAREEINEINKDWQDQLTEWSIDDKIAELEALRDAEVAQVQVAIDALQKATSEMSTSSVSSVSSAMSGMSDAYSGTITETSKETEDLAYETMTNIAQATFDTYADAFLAPIREEYYGIFYDSLDVTSNVFDIMYQNFNDSFVSKAKIDLDALFFQYASKIASFSTLSGGSLSGNTNTYNNSSKSMNNYMNISNSSSASSVYRIMNDMYN